METGAGDGIGQGGCKKSDYWVGRTGSCEITRSASEENERTARIDRSRDKPFNPFGSSGNDTTKPNGEQKHSGSSSEGSIDTFVKAVENVREAVQNDKIPKWIGNALTKEVTKELLGVKETKGSRSNAR
jgi:hypothetical protein